MTIHTKSGFRAALTGAAIASIATFFANPLLAADYTMKISMGDPEPSADDYHYSRTPLLKFAEEVEEKSDGRIDVEIFWGGQLGKVENVLNLVRGGQVEAAVASDGHVAPYYSDVQVLGLPYLFIDRKVAYDVLDGEVGQMLSDRMAAESGIRPLPWLENGGYRHYSSNTPLRTADDMKGLKIRTMNNPVHMQIVSSLGASPTPIPWADLYTSLQTGVVDGQENALSTFRVPRLEEVQSNIILDGHVYSIIMLATSEKWLQSLPEDLRAVVETAADNMKALNRKISLENEGSDRAYLEGAGVTIVDPPVEEKAKFQQMTQGPALEALKGAVDSELLDSLLSSVKAAEANL